MNPEYATKKITNGMPRNNKNDTYTLDDQDYMRGLYDGGMLYTDRCLSLLFGELKERGVFDNSIIVISSDHGELLGEDGQHWGHISISSDYLTHTPLIIRGPGVPKGLRIAELTENVDIMPTLLDLAGIETEAEMDGVSLCPLMRGDAPQRPRPYVFSKYNGELPGTTATFVLRDGKYKLEFPVTGEDSSLWHVSRCAPGPHQLCQD